MRLLKEAPDVKCEVAELIYNELVTELYGVQNCDFGGYNSIYDLIFQIDLIEAEYNCNKKHCH